MADIYQRQQAPPQARDAIPGIPRRRTRRWTSTLARLLLLFLFGVGFVASMLPWGRAVTDTILILPALLTASEPLPLQISGEPIKHTQMTVSSSNGPVFLDLYAPTSPIPQLSGSRRGMLIIPGVGDNRQVPQLVNLAQTLARMGMVAMTMTTQTLIKYDLSARDSDAVVQAFKTLAQVPGVGQQRIGIIAFSGGTPLACFAATDPRIRDEVAYLVLFGGYFNAKSLLDAFGRRAMDINGKMVPWSPAPVPIETMANIITKYLPPADRVLIQHALAPGGSPLTPDKLAQLSPPARAAYELLTGSAPNKVNANIAMLPPAAQAELNTLSPSRVVAQIRAPIFLLHDLNDPSIPFTESVDFAHALARLHHPYSFVELHIFNHVEVRSHLQLIQMLSGGAQLFGVLTQILQIRA
jgi:pimeloyl-ACP methyl ester carboxylesterase